MDKPLFQINYDEENNSYKYIVNEMSHQEFLAFLTFLKMCVRKFSDDEYYNFISDGDEENGINN